MKISISSPPLENPKGVPLLSQNRQFQWFKDPTYIYPIVPALAATLLRSKGFDVFWDDGIAEEITYGQWLKRIVRETPDVIAIETKTPVVKRHWEILRELRERLPGTKTVLMGDHVTALPQESMEQSPVDFVLTGGDYDFLLTELCEVLADSSGKEPLKTQRFPGGIWFRENGFIVQTGPIPLRHDLSALPRIDRDLTHWKRYAFHNGNFKHRPGAYVMAARDCWWGRCTFCSWTTLYPGETFRVRPVEQHLDEIGHLIEDHGVYEIFDDSGCFPRGEWLEAFCRGLIDRGYPKRVVLGCNMRVGGLNREQWALLGRAGFRFVLIGLESVNPGTLKRLNKNIRVDQIEETCRMAKESGLEPHLTVMTGYPWETREDAEATLNFAERMFRAGHIDSLQATIVVPYPGTPLFEEARMAGWLTTLDWDRYDMREAVWNTPIHREEILKLTQRFYRSALAPRFLLRKVLSIRSLDDLSYLIRAGKKVLGHLADFSTSTLSKKA